MAKTNSGNWRTQLSLEEQNHKQFSGFIEQLPTQKREQKLVILSEAEWRQLNALPAGSCWLLKKSMCALKRRFAFVRNEENHKNAKRHLII